MTVYTQNISIAYNDITESCSVRQTVSAIATIMADNKVYGGEAVSYAIETNKKEFY